MQNRFKTWGDVRIFLAVARKGSTLKASKTLGMTQTTVARRIEALEHALGLTLFERNTRGFRLTESGAALLDPAESIETAADAFATKAAARAAAASGAIRITAPGAALGETTQKLLRRFAETNPDTRFLLFPEEKELDLEAGEADLAFRFAPAITDDRLIARKIREIRIGFYASKDYVERNGLPDHPEDLRNHDIVNFVDGHGPVAAGNWLKTFSDPNRVVQSCTDFSTAGIAVSQGAGIGPIGAALAESMPELVEVFPPRPETNSAVWLVVSSSAWKRPEVKTFARFVVPAWREAWSG